MTGAALGSRSDRLAGEPFDAEPGRSHVHYSGISRAPVQSSRGEDMSIPRGTATGLMDLGGLTDAVVADGGDIRRSPPPGGMPSADGFRRPPPGVPTRSSSGQQLDGSTLVQQCYPVGGLP